MHALIVIVKMSYYQINLSLNQARRT